mmetsp:Transcript_13843/g.28380  ORF Transcript_13843/g.28380 Transcript_13843/m.28380 type:complete len:107 (+) Transcript_13843:897-1217(+)
MDHLEDPPKHIFFHSFCFCFCCFSLLFSSEIMVQNGGAEYASPENYCSLISLWSFTQAFMNIRQLVFPGSHLIPVGSGPILSFCHVVAPRGAVPVIEMSVDSGYRC